MDHADYYFACCWYGAVFSIWKEVKGGFMNKSISVALLVVGVVLLIFGYNAYHSAASDVSRFFTGEATNKAIWLLGSGLVAGIVGLVGVVKK